MTSPLVVHVLGRALRRERMTPGSAKDEVVAARLSNSSLLSPAFERGAPEAEMPDFLRALSALGGREAFALSCSA
jgi:hypothetical protein